MVGNDPRGHEFKKRKNNFPIHPIPPFFLLLLRLQPSFVSNISSLREKKKPHKVKSLCSSLNEVSDSWIFLSHVIALRHFQDFFFFFFILRHQDDEDERLLITSTFHQISPTTPIPHVPQDLASVVVGVGELGD